MDKVNTETQHATDDNKLQPPTISDPLHDTLTFCIYFLNPTSKTDIN